MRTCIPSLRRTVELIRCVSLIIGSSLLGTIHFLFRARSPHWSWPYHLFALFMQAMRAGSTEGLIQGPPYHCDINGMRALFPADRWDWPKPPYASIEHPAGLAELAVELVRR